MPKAGKMGFTQRREATESLGGSSAGTVYASDSGRGGRAPTFRCP